MVKSILKVFFLLSDENFYGEKYTEGFFLLSDEQLFILQKAMILNSPRGVLKGREREKKKIHICNEL
jgi:hypothetical protein